MMLSNQDANAHPSPRRPLLLASASPRRRELLQALGHPYVSATADIDEGVFPNEAPESYVLRMAETKARALAEHFMMKGAEAEGPGSEAPDPPLVIGADTIVVFEGRILGKPASAAEAVEVLRALRGHRHLVHTGLALFDPSSGIASRDLASTGVWMRDYTEAELEAYVASGDPMDKAGAYAIQHPVFRPVARLEGSEANVIGLPLALLATLIGRFDARS